MNIKEAKEQIKNAMTAYFTKDEYGNYRIPIEKQRPIFLMGPPGIGKTAIMEQVAAELGVGLVSYSMTHHTRQSALGLPYIVTREFGGQKYSATEYTMSEIIASVYELMAKTGLKEGILFLDEINCVSETLAPCMLQFLQFKIFGQHRVPEGWIVVTAGNPPEYNKSVRSFDLVTWDRLKRIDVEPDYEVWREYALQAGVHPAVMTYLSARKKDFYQVEAAGDLSNFVTARGWDDLSQMIFLYEEHRLKVDEKLVGQYLQNRRIAKNFAIYYDLFTKYRSDYQVEAILEGKPPEAVIFRAKQAAFDERLTLLAIIFDAVGAELKEVVEQEKLLTALVQSLKVVQQDLKAGRAVEESLKARIASERAALQKSRLANASTRNQQRRRQKLILALEEELAGLQKMSGKLKDEGARELLKSDLAVRVEQFKDRGAKTRERLDHVFTFAEQAFGEGQEILLLVTELTANQDAAAFISRFGSDKYYAYNKALDFQERQMDILKRIEELNLEQ